MIVFNESVHLDIATKRLGTAYKRRESVENSACMRKVIIKILWYTERCRSHNACNLNSAWRF